MNALRLRISMPSSTLRLKIFIEQLMSRIRRKNSTITSQLKILDCHLRIRLTAFARTYPLATSALSSWVLAAANNSASTDGFKFDTEAALEPRETRPVRIKPAAVLAAVKARPLGVRASGK